MSEAQGDKPVSQPKKFHDALEALVGRVVTAVKPESYEDAPIGHRLTTGFHRAKVVELGDDMITLVTEYLRAQEKSKEPVEQFVPLDKIKRISLVKSERVIHI